MLKATAVLVFVTITCISIHVNEGLNLIGEFNDFNVTQKAGEGATDVCDFTACNGLEIEKEFDGTSFLIGQCQSPVNQDGFGCFVNEDSICPKKSTKFPGMFSSTKPCEDSNAPLVECGFGGPGGWCDILGSSGKVISEWLVTTTTPTTTTTTTTKAITTTVTATTKKPTTDCKCNINAKVYQRGEITGNCQTEINGKFFCYVDNEECGEDNSSRFADKWINYSLCDCQKYPESCNPNVVKMPGTANIDGFGYGFGWNKLFEVPKGIYA